MRRSGRRWLRLSVMDALFRYRATLPQIALSQHPHPPHPKSPQTALSDVWFKTACAAQHLIWTPSFPDVSSLMHFQSSLLSKKTRLSYILIKKNVTSPMFDKKKTFWMNIMMQNPSIKKRLLINSKSWVCISKIMKKFQCCKNRSHFLSILMPEFHYFFNMYTVYE